MAGVEMDRWVILRTAATSTLRLAGSLGEAGFETWAPVETIRRRLPRSAKHEVVSVPLLKSFVFARADRIDDLLALSHSPSLSHQAWDAHLRRMVTKGHPYFRLMPDADVEPADDFQTESFKR